MSDQLNNAPGATDEAKELSFSRSAVAFNQANTKPAEKVIIKEADCYEELPFAWSERKKWLVMAVISLIQLSMNMSCSLYANAMKGMASELNVSAMDTTWGVAVNLIAYAIGCELWAPLSEEKGRWTTLQLSMLLLNLFQLPVALAQNLPMVLVGRALNGLCMAGGSVTIGMIADMWEAESQQYAVGKVGFFSVTGAALGPVVGGFVEELLGWRWCIWIPLLLGVFVQAVHFFIVPETRTTLCMDKIAQRRRRANPDLNLWGPGEVAEPMNVREVLGHIARPFVMFYKEPIVLTLSLLSGFADALIFMFLQAFDLVYKNWQFKPAQVGLAFTPIILGYFIAWGLYILAIRRNRRLQAAHPEDDKVKYESRLWWLRWTAPALPIGLFIFAWTCTGPPISWYFSMGGAVLIGIANYSIYASTIDYMVAAYGPYSASATGGNGFARDFLAGVLTMPAKPFFKNIGPNENMSLAYASTILGAIACVLVAFVYYIYCNGPTLRAKSPFAQKIVQDKIENGPVKEVDLVKAEVRSPEDTNTQADTLMVPVEKKKRPAFGPAQRMNSEARLEQHQRVEKATKMFTPSHTPATSRPASPCPPSHTQSMHLPTPPLGRMTSSHSI